jgi:hypothetical protein
VGIRLAGAVANLPGAGVVVKPLHIFVLLGGIYLLTNTPTARAQVEQEKGDRELQVWTSGGYGVKGIESHTGVWSAGVRYGWVLTAPRGPGFLQGRLEYAADVAPVFVVFQPSGTAYGVAISPLNLKWNFARRGRVVPFVDLGASYLITNRETPPGTSRENFVTSSALGVNFVAAKLHYSVDVRFSHISDSGLTPINPGINVLQARLGVGLFRTRHHKD